MGEQEPQEIIGRTLGEHGEAKRKLAALEAKSRSYAGGMRTVAQELSPARPDFVRVVTEVFGRDLEEGALEMYPNRTEVAELSEQVRAAKGKLETLAKSLRELGVTV
jgi:hypothetical protein